MNANFRQQLLSLRDLRTGIAGSSRTIRPVSQACRAVLQRTQIRALRRDHVALKHMHDAVPASVVGHACSCYLRIALHHNRTPLPRGDPHLEAK